MPDNCDGICPLGYGSNSTHGYCDGCPKDTSVQPKQMTIPIVSKHDIRIKKSKSRKQINEEFEPEPSQPQSQQGPQSLLAEVRSHLKINPYSLWKDFIERFDQVDIITDSSIIEAIDTQNDFSSVKLTNPPDPNIYKEIIHELADNYYGHRITGIAIISFGDDRLYEELESFDLIRLTDILKQTLKIFYIERDDYQIPIPILSIKSIKSKESSPHFWAHVIKKSTNKILQDTLNNSHMELASPGKISDMAERFGMEHGDYVLATQIFAFNYIFYNRQKSDFNEGYRKYVHPFGYLSDIQKSIKKYRKELQEYFTDFLPIAKSILYQQKLLFEDAEKNNLLNDPNIPDKVKVKLPTKNNIKKMEKCIEKIEEIINKPITVQKTMNDEARQVLRERK